MNMKSSFTVFMDHPDLNTAFVQPSPFDIKKCMLTGYVDRYDRGLLETAHIKSRFRCNDQETYIRSI